MKCSIEMEKRLRGVALTCLLSVGCGGGSDRSGTNGTGGNVASGGRVESRGTGGSSANAGSGGSTASAGTVSEGGSGGAPGGAPVADPCVENQTCPLNTWIDVTPEGIVIPDPGLRSVVGNTAVPSEIFMGAGEAGIWKSEDYGNTWTMVNPGFGYVPQGLCFAVLPSEPATLLVAATGTDGTIHKSTDAGATWYDTGGDLPSQLYSLTVDPYDSNHIISGFHEADGVAESTDAGETWHVVGTTGFPMGGISWYPFFIDTGAADTTSQTWLAIAQNGGSVTITRDGGHNWSVPSGISGLTHPHGSAQIFQRGQTLFVPGTDGPGQGVYRSTDLGKTFTRVSGDIAAAVAWGNANHVYSMYSWSCFNCTVDPKFLIGSANGDSWTPAEVPAPMLMGADHVTVTSDGTHNIFVAAMRNYGIWRYVEE
ncbi:MAG: hypothetical protein WDO74_01855 [Pseudomonadota bacterium]